MLEKLLIKRSSSWIRTKIMLLLNIKNFWVLPIVLLLQACSLLYQKNHPNHRNSLR
ncbi:hypothetical protein CsatA_023231 [Cannabis sativa]